MSKSSAEKIKEEIDWAFGRYLSAKDMGSVSYGLVKAAVEPIVENLLVIQEERDEAQREHTDMMWQRRRAEERAGAAEAERDSLRIRLQEAREAMIWALGKLNGS